MSIPTHNLYDFVHQATERRFWLRYFYPWGSRGIINLINYQVDNDFLAGVNGIPVVNQVSTSLGLEKNHYIYVEKFQPILLCHDQEPLNFDLYSDNNSMIEQLQQASFSISNLIIYNKNLIKPNLNIRWYDAFSFQKYWILLHSELNSKEVEKYINTGMYKSAFWWSHAVIARDWYRYAEYDKNLRLFNYNNIQQLFLCYCRDTGGTRQYRKEFLNLLKHHELSVDCKFQTDNIKTVDANFSATYSVEDFNATAISVVLETIADDRIHLTEKILRPIACGHPFMLMAGPGSLNFLKKYKFKTFSPFINESYDQEKNQTRRMEMIIEEMTRIQKLPTPLQQELIEKCQLIARHNREVFFSDEFQDQVVKELISNVDNAYRETNNELDFDFWWNTLKIHSKNKKKLHVSNPIRRNSPHRIYVHTFRQYRKNIKGGK